eukprot:scaffold3731_cov381-Prasinococcus_capsulatus_cf.AAC.2
MLGAANLARKKAQPPQPARKLVIKPLKGTLEPLVTSLAPLGLVVRGLVFALRRSARVHAYTASHPLQPRLRCQRTSKIRRGRSSSWLLRLCIGRGPSTRVSKNYIGYVKRPLAVCLRLTYVPDSYLKSRYT